MSVCGGGGLCLLISWAPKSQDASELQVVDVHESATALPLVITPVDCVHEHKLPYFIIVKLGKHVLPR